MDARLAELEAELAGVVARSPVTALRRWVCLLFCYVGGRVGEEGEIGDVQREEEDYAS